MELDERYVSVFESSVVLDGTKTFAFLHIVSPAFESSVVLDGTKTSCTASYTSFMFESSVVLDGTKTAVKDNAAYIGLRVVLF